MNNGAFSLEARMANTFYSSVARTVPKIKVTCQCHIVVACYFNIKLSYRAFRKWNYFLWHNCYRPIWILYVYTFVNSPGFCSYQDAHTSQWSRSQCPCCRYSSASAPPSLRRLLQAIYSPYCGDVQRIWGRRFHGRTSARQVGPLSLCNSLWLLPRLWYSYKSCNIFHTSSKTH